MLLISIVKALIEVAGMCVIAQMLVGLLSGAGRQNNPIYRLFAVITRPVHGLVRRIMPSLVLDAHIPLASLFVLSALWLLAVYGKYQLMLVQ